MKFGILLALSIAGAVAMSMASESEPRAWKYGGNEQIDAVEDDPREWQEPVWTGIHLNTKKAEAQDAFLDEIAASAPKGHENKMSSKVFNITDILRPQITAYGAREDTIFASSEGGYDVPFSLKKISTYHSTAVFGAGSLKVQGAILRTINHLTLELKPKWETHFQAAKMTLHMETDKAQSDARVIHLDNLSLHCPRTGPNGHHECHPKRAVTIGPFWVPAFPEMTMNSGGIGALRIVITDQQGYWLFKGKIFVAKSTSPRD